MPDLSPRLMALNGDDGDDGWGVFHKARQMIAAGQPVTELTIGEHDIRTDPSILDAMHRSAKGGHTGYAMVPGVHALRDAVAQRTEARTGVPTTRENVLITPGGQAGLFAAHMALLQEGDTGLFIDPYYATYPASIRGTGARAVAVQTSAQNSFIPQAAELTQAATRTQAKSLLINTPNNPTGVVYPAEALEQIAEVCRAQDLWLISDEVYDTQVWDGTHHSPRALPGMAERTLVIGSMSKSHAMTGSRVGWVIGPPQAVTLMIDLATATTYGVPGFVQDGALFALTEGTTLEGQVAAPFRRRRAIAQDILSKQNLIRLIPSGGAMYLFLDIRATGLTGEDFATKLLNTHHIAVMPGESFGASGAGHIRVAMTVEDTAFADALTQLCHFAQACQTIA